MSINVLIVDDSLSACRVLSRHFLLLDVDKVEFCRDARSAIRTLSKYKDDYQIVVVDLHMPEVDGIEFLMRLSKMDFKGGIIIASAMESRIVEAASQLVEASKLRLLGALMKPVTTEQLRVCVERYRLMAFQGNGVSQKGQMSIDEIRRAINSNKVIPYYQAQVDIASGQIKGFEVLCRLQQGTRLQLITPDKFIEVAESNNALNSLTTKLLNSAIPEWALISQFDSCQQCRLSINLTPKQLNQSGWHTRLMQYCEQNLLSPSRLTVEITENQVLDKQRQHSSISQLRMNRIGVAIDDFGTGYTNLSQLCTLPISELKLDRSLVHGIHKDPVSQTILRSMQAIGSKLGIHLVAEGVEDIHDLNYLEQIEDISLQGYLICRPKPYSELVRWLKARERLLQA
ncbi:EAL domain-containing response regulator [Shewanella insulae]|uniref:EAL domain-containing response regulator n=1 Tax=Shewanella insulae TaxID=2681496 RepID=UPI001EFD5E9C|nr:EAL domain-containing response regulator [Shewanella insulae]MCG9711459.1 EAL domain-containing response regulator [Shewanella insulae]MCG9753886.1 EAL domain-containing response regulator [Shewanella insulae]